MSDDTIGKPSGFGPKHNWKCPRLGCKKEICAWTEGGLIALREPHIREHEMQDRENMILFQKVIADTPRDYDKWEPTLQDKAFLKTRYIKAD